jgi:hypothetical protein
MGFFVQDEGSGEDDCGERIVKSECELQDASGKLQVKT